MSRWFIVLALLLAACTAVAQPGLCPCWLMADVANHHPHPSGHPEQPHSHDYLLNLFSSQVILAATLTFITATALIRNLETGAVYILCSGASATPRDWTRLVEPPPPRIFNH